MFVVLQQWIISSRTCVDEHEINNEDGTKTIFVSNLIPF